MKVLMANTFHHRRGGDATYTLSLSELLRARGHQVVPLAMRHPDNLPSEWERWFLPLLDYRDLSHPRDRLRAMRNFVHNRRAAQVTRALIARERPDVLHLQHVHHHLTPSVIGPAREAGIPVVWTVHDYELICPSGHLFVDGAPCERCKGHRYHHAIEHRCKRGALGPSALAALESTVHALQGVWKQVDRFLCPSRFLADKLISFGVEARHVHHCPNFVDVPHTPAPELGEGWLYAGRLAEEKGVWTLLQAARQLPGVPLTICGSGPLEPALRRAAQDLPHVQFLGHLTASELQRRLEAAAVVAVPSIWYENFPYAVLEAQVLGRGVVASRIGGIPEQIRHGEDGLLVPPGDATALADAVRCLLDDPQKNRRLGLSGRARVEATLSSKQHLERILAHYREVSARTVTFGAPRS